MSDEEISIGLISVGTELTEGSVQDEHIKYIGSILKSSGFTLEKAVLLPDRQYVFCQTVKDFSKSADIVIITGGLGPTGDDLTRTVLAEAGGLALEFHEDVWKGIQRQFPQSEEGKSNRSQAFVPHSFQILQNAVGTAPGLTGRIGKARIFALPGPPGELRPMFEKLVLPLLQSEYRCGGSEELEGVSFLIPEARLEDLLRDSRTGNTSWSTRADGPRVLFTLRGAGREEREEMFRKLQTAGGSFRVRRGSLSSQEILFQALRRKSRMLVTAESCTGGMLGELLTAIPGSSEVYWGGFITYTNEAKQSVLGVDGKTLEHSGAVSESTVREMAGGALRNSGGDVSIAVSGIAGPSGGSPAQHVGTVCIGVCVEGREAEAWKFRFSGNREAVRMKSAVLAFLLTESIILEKESLDSGLNSEYI